MRIFILRSERWRTSPMQFTSGGLARTVGSATAKPNERLPRSRTCSRSKVHAHAESVVGGSTNNGKTMITEKFSTLASGS